MQDDLFLAPLTLRALHHGRIVFIVAVAVAVEPLAAALGRLAARLAGVFERRPEPRLLAVAERAGQHFDGLDELSQLVEFDLVVLELLVDLPPELGELRALEVLGDAGADQLERLVHALGDAGGRAEAADRHREAVAELGRPRRQPEPLDEGILLRLIAHGELELHRRRGELDVEDVLEQLLLPAALVLRADVEGVERLDRPAQLGVLGVVDVRGDLAVGLGHHLVEDLDGAE